MIDSTPDFFKSEDTVFHYTTARIAIENILFSKLLRLSPVKDSSDPFESESSRNPTVIQQFCGFPGEARLPDEESSLARVFIQKLAKEAKHICFCTNIIGRKPWVSINPMGHLLPRMWDQYGDKYCGVCLAFSFQALKEADHRISWNQRSYLSYENFRMQDPFIISENKILSHPNNHHDLMKDDFDRYLNRKHQDYFGEREIRGLIYSPEEYEYLNIEGSLLGIVACFEKIGDFNTHYLYKYCDEHNVELLNIFWRDHYYLVESKADRQPGNNLHKVLSDLSNRDDSEKNI